MWLLHEFSFILCFFFSFQIYILFPMDELIKQIRDLVEFQVVWIFLSEWEPTCYQAFGALWKLESYCPIGRNHFPAFSLEIGFCCNLGNIDLAVKASCPLCLRNIIENVEFIIARIKLFDTLSFVEFITNSINYERVRRFFFPN